MPFEFNNGNLNRTKERNVAPETKKASGMQEDRVNSPRETNSV